VTGKAEVGEEVGGAGDVGGGGGAENVVGLNVAVEDVATVEVGEGGEDVAGEVEDDVQGEGRLLLQVRAEGAAGDEIGYDDHIAFGQVGEVAKGHDARVAKGEEGGEFVEGAALGAGDKVFKGDGGSVAAIVGKPDDGLGAGADEGVEFVALA